jgi:hypothetical protein
MARMTCGSLGERGPPPRLRRFGETASACRLVRNRLADKSLPSRSSPEGRAEAGWEAGIRTPITWSRERCTRSLLLPSVRFHPVLFVTASICSFLLASVLVQRVSLCLRPNAPGWSAIEASSASSHTSMNASSGRNLKARRPAPYFAVRPRLGSPALGLGCWSYRRIERETGVRPETVSGYDEVRRAHAAKPFPGSDPPSATKSRDRARGDPSNPAKTFAARTEIRPKHSPALRRRGGLPRRGITRPLSRSASSA